MLVAMTVVSYVTAMLDFVVVIRVGCNHTKWKKMWEKIFKLLMRLKEAGAALET